MSLVGFGRPLAEAEPKSTQTRLNELSAASLFKQHIDSKCKTQTWWREGNEWKFGVCEADGGERKRGVGTERSEEAKDAEGRGRMEAGGVDQGEGMAATTYTLHILHV